MRCFAFFFLAALSTAHAAPDAQRLATIDRVCQRLQACGCPEAECKANFLKASHQPIEALRCAMSMPCADICAEAPAGKQTRPVRECFDAAQHAKVKVEFRDLAPERWAVIKASCAHIAKCGCGEEECIRNLRRSTLPLESLSCIQGFECKTICDPAAGDASSPVQSQCFAPKDKAALHAAERGKQLKAYCAKRTQCGCPRDGCVEFFDTNTSNYGLELHVCLASMDCESICKSGDIATKDVPAWSQCVAPELARVEARKARQKSAIEAVKSSHRINMKIIRAIGGSNRRVYDQNGTYLYTE